MKRLLSVLLTVIALLAANQPATICAETETIDLKALAKKARPAVMLLVVSDANGKEIATGTGFLVSSDGKLITNFHVIEKAASAVAKAENGGLFPIEGTLASDPKNDLVLLKLKGKDLPFLTLGKSENIEVGTRIAVIGSPLGLEGTLAEGIVSAVRELMSQMRVLQISAPISSGSSGSPVLNANGEVVGIASALIREGQSLSFAIPSEVAGQLLAKGEDVSRPNSFGVLALSGDSKFVLDPAFKAIVASAIAQNSVETLKHAQTLVRNHPEHYLAHSFLGTAKLQMKLTAEAVSAFQHAIKLRPDFACAWYNLGVCYREQGQTAKEVEAYKKAVALDPDFANAWYNLGLCYEKAGSRDEAIMALREAIRLVPSDAEAWYNLGWSYGALGSADFGPKLPGVSGIGFH